MQLDVIYRDDRLIAVNKPSGTIVHRGWGLDDVTVYDIIRDQIIGAPVYALHRLDRGTSGVLLFALDSDAARIMQANLDAAEVRKTYVALVRGPMREACTVNHAIKQREKDERIDAVTEFEPVEHVDRWSLIHARPITGRTHQIRLHLKHLSHPIVGDVRYGKGDINRHFRETYNLHRMALHCRSLVIRNVDRCVIELKAPLPADLMKPFHQIGFRCESL